MFASLYYAEKDYPSTNTLEDEQPGPQLLPRLAWSEGEQIDDLENTEQILTERDALANAFTWGTTTQRYGHLKFHNAECSLFDFVKIFSN